MAKITTDLVAELCKTRRRLGLSRALIARMLQTNENNIFRWETRTHSPSHVFRSKIRRLLKVVQEIEEEIHKENQDE